MNVLTRTAQVLTGRLKAFVMQWASRSSWVWGTSLGRTRYDYAEAAGDGRGNAIVVSVILWLCRTFPEAPIRVMARNGDGDLDPQPGHPLTELLARPNPHYSGVLLWMATIADWMLGNAYWLKVRNGAGRVLELWWIPSNLIEPKYPEDGSQYLSHYDYTPNGTPIRLEVADVVHFRYGLDPTNQRKGLSPLGSLLREIFTDDEAANFSAALLKNLGVPGLVIAPDEDVQLTQADADQIKAEAGARFTNDNRGAVMVMSARVKTTVLSFNPQQMDLKTLRRLPEERVSAIFGVPAVVVGLGAGLDRSTFANYAEAREAAYESNVIPTQRLLAAELATQLLPEFGDPKKLSIDFDLSQVRVLQPDLDALWRRLDVGVRGGWIFPDEAREKVGYDPLPDKAGEVLYVPVSAVPTLPADIALPPEPVPLPEPTPLRALPEPPPKARRRKSSAHNFAAGLTRIRQRHQARMERELAAYLLGQQARVIERLAAQEKAIRWEDIFDVASEVRSLRTALERWYRRILGGVHTLTEDALGASFDLDDPLTRQFLAEAGKEIVGITETTRQAVASALQEGQAAGEGVPQLAKRIEMVTEFARPRATAIARTELGHASNAAAMTSYRASGVVVGVRIFDGDGCGLRSHDDPEKADGKVLPLDQMSGIPTLAHPNCVRAFGAVTDPSEVEAAA